MTLLTAFAALLLLAVLLFSLANRTILSTAALFLVAGIAASQQVFQLVAITIVLPILLHSSTDVVAARGFDDERDVPAWFGIARRIRGGGKGETSL